MRFLQSNEIVVNSVYVTLKPTPAGKQKQDFSLMTGVQHHRSVVKKVTADAKFGSLPTSSLPSVKSLMDVPTPS